MARERRFAGIKDVISHLNAVGSRGLAAIGSRSKARLTEDEKVVTLQVGKSVFDGAPRNMRTELWMSSLQRKGIGVAASQKYEDMLLSPVGAEAAADIDKDLGRTFPTTKRFAAAEGQEALRRVLRAYAAFDPEVGYCQGMNFVAGLLLMYLPERHAFGGLVVLMQDRGLRTYYSTDMSLLQTHLWQLGRLMPSCLCSHLEAIGVLPLLYGASWLMTCFSADFPASFSARVMDVIMADKMDQALLKAAVALLKRCEAKLLQLHDMEDALHLLKLELPAWEEPLLHDVLTDAFSKPWSNRQTQLLGSLEGAETVAEALTRVQRANLAASVDSTVSTDSAAAAEELDSPAAAARTPGTSRGGTPAPAVPAASPTSGARGGTGGGGGAAAAAAAAAAGASAGSSSSGSSGGAEVVAAMPVLLPPPPLRRPSSAGGASGGVSPVASRPPSRAVSQCGVVSGVATTPGAAAEPGLGGSAGHSSSSTQAAAGLLGLQQHHHHHRQQQQPVQQDMIDMSSPRAAAGDNNHVHWPAAASSSASSMQALQPQSGQQLTHRASSWDPFGIEQGGQSAATHTLEHSSSLGQQTQQQQQHAGQTAQQLQQSSQSQPAAPAAPDDTGQQLLLQELQDLSFSHITSPGAIQHLQQHSPLGQPPAHIVQTAGAGARTQQAKAKRQELQLPAQLEQHKQQQLEEDEWGDFLSPHAAT